ncbi:MAG: NAD(P)H-binding protein, partial [Acetobacteraceae bacterium]|nr:NAD(P)H-binding protein [Acetobacteraceae bacterium]
MRILVIGAGGFIGSHLVASLLGTGHHVTGGVRNAVALRRRFPAAAAVGIRLSTDPGYWARLAGDFDGVVNAIGALRGDLDLIHHRAPVALFEGCARAGLHRLVQISALGADAGAQSQFHRTKHAADARFLGLAGERGQVGWHVIRPSLVIGRGGQSTAMFSGLAGLPVAFQLGHQAGLVQPIHVDDLVRVLVALLEGSAPAPACLDLVGPEPMRIEILIDTLRDWLGFPAPRWAVPVPRPLLRSAARIGDYIPGATLNTETLGMLARGNTADIAPLEKTFARPSRPLAEALAIDPAFTADRWHARLLT